MIVAVGTMGMVQVAIDQVIDVIPVERFQFRPFDSLNFGFQQIDAVGRWSAPGSGRHKQYPGCPGGEVLDECGEVKC